MPSEDRYTARSDVLRQAEQLTTTDRNKSYGEPDESFQMIAAAWSALGGRLLSGDTIRQMRGSDVAIFMAALKLVRLTWDPTHRDSWVDTAGYAGCGFETALLEEQRAQALLPLPAPALISVMGGAGLPIPNDVWEAAHKACGGDPTDLEEMGYFIGNAADGANACSPACGKGSGSHIFRPGCAYRVKARRKDDDG